MVPKLKRLDIQSNRLTKIENLQSLKNLEELYLSCNGIENIENLEALVREGVEVAPAVASDTLLPAASVLHCRRV